ncbi:NosD domain-containing protein [Anaerocolumna sp. AGMB13020]|uniref:NosD domain-containing protein n=1 Tax=Anaerocolumna sp. AGMB13020 TaxID=3081750 RepID=UPI002952D640|nr:right-handed parallel beta-helix repeat-containing protein [Anaerocolumna sp. AGMB13020]WOO37961.1 NosD domain-containing protein [Anaerocolumna sp. AGMB13020]
MAVFYVTPLTNIEEFINSDEVMPGDVLLLEDGVYRQSVSITKNHIRIVANGKCVVFEGEDTLLTGINLNNVEGVEILGLQFQNYLINAIVITQGSSNRIRKNRMFKGNIGISVVRSSGNLIHNNVVENAVLDGIRLAFTSTGNYVLENEISNSGDDGIDCFFLEDANNLLVGNVARENTGNGFEVLGEKCCVFKNCAIANGENGLLLLGGANIVALQNEAHDNKLSGITTNSSNFFIGLNTVAKNEREGLGIYSDFGIVEENDIRFNLNYGLLIDENADYNLVLRNCFLNNVPENISDNGTGNNFIENVDGKSPCESESVPMKGVTEKAVNFIDYLYEKLKKETERKNELIVIAEAALVAVPESKRQAQELFLKQLKEQLTQLAEYKETRKASQPSSATSSVSQQPTAEE